MKLAIALFVLMVCATACVADGAATRPPEGARDVLTVHAKRPSQWKQALDVTIVTAASVESLKRTIKDPRPHGEGHAHGSGYGFPSRDATLAFALARSGQRVPPRAPGSLVRAGSAGGLVAGEAAGA